jgi:hypothetical protein
MLAERGNDVKREGGAENVSAYRRIGVSAYRRIGVLSRYRFTFAYTLGCAAGRNRPFACPRLFLYRAFGAELGKTKS